VFTMHELSLTTETGTRFHTTTTSTTQPTIITIIATSATMRTAVTTTTATNISILQVSILSSSIISTKPQFMPDIQQWNRPIAMDMTTRLS